MRNAKKAITSISFPIPRELAPIYYSLTHIYQGLDYYLQARYAFFHRMNAAFMMNAYWAVEHMVESILIYTKNESEHSHSLMSDWEKAKDALSEESDFLMDRFDDYIEEVGTYFDQHNENAQTPKVRNLAHMSLDELDFFINSMLQDITIFSRNCSKNLKARLESQDNLNLYGYDNKFSIIDSVGYEPIVPKFSLRRLLDDISNALRNLLLKLNEGLHY